MKFDMDSFAVLWSPAQNSLAVETVAEMLNQNRSIFDQQMGGDFVVLSFHPNREEAGIACSRFQRIRDARLDES